METSLSSINFRADQRLTVDSGAQPEEKAFTMGSYSLGDKIVSFLARMPIFHSTEFSRAELKNSATANTAFIHAIREQFGSNSAEKARETLGLDLQRDRVISSTDARDALGAARRHLYQQRTEAIDMPGLHLLQIKQDGLVGIGFSSEVKPGSAQLETLLQATDQVVPAGQDAQVQTASLALLQKLVTSHVRPGDVLLLRKTLTGDYLQLGRPGAVVSDDFKKSASDATQYLRGIPALAASLPRCQPGSERPMTALQLQQLFFHELGGSTQEREQIARTPTEVTMHWVEKLTQAASELPDGKKRDAVVALRDQEQSRWMAHRMSLEETRTALENASGQLRTLGLGALADAAARDRSDGGGAASTLSGSSLLDQLPELSAEKGKQATGGVLATRLNDNIYGRVFESLWVNGLVEKPPASVLSSMHAVGKELARTLEALPTSERHAVLHRFQTIVGHDPRFWTAKVEGLKELSEATSPDQRAARTLALLQRMPQSGWDAIAIPFLAVKLHMALRETREGGGVSGNPFQWAKDTDENYTIVGQSANRHANTVGPSSLVPAAGITLRSQPNAVQEDWMEARLRPAEKNRYDERDLTPQVQRALTQGVPYVSGVSGSTNIMLGWLGHMRDTGQEVDARAALLGTIMFLNYDGGHAIHEALWTAHQRENELHLGLVPEPEVVNDESGGEWVLVSASKQAPAHAFVSDYGAFQSLYAKTDDCRDALSTSLAQAWGGSIDYLRKHSYYADAPLPAAAAAAAAAAPVAVGFPSDAAQV